MVPWSGVPPGLHYGVEEGLNGGKVFDLSQDSLDESVARSGLPAEGQGNRILEATTY